MIRYFDASALVKRYVEEDGTDTDELVRLLAEDRPATSRYSLIEIASALARRAREGDLTDTQIDAARTVLEADSKRLLLVELTPEVVDIASGLLARHPLRAGDALHLASCLYLHARTGGRIAFVGYDERLNEAVEAEGVELLP